MGEREGQPKKDLDNAVRCPRHGQAPKMLTGVDGWFDEFLEERRVLPAHKHGLRFWEESVGHPTL